MMRLGYNIELLSILFVDVCPSVQDLFAQDLVANVFVVIRALPEAGGVILIGR